MNTIQSLTEHGISISTANRMIDSYKEKIGTMNGIYEITDIAYDFENKGKVVSMKCSECGNEIQRTLIKNRNKWSELIKTCPCQIESRRKIAFEKSEKNKKRKKEEAERKRLEIEKRKSEYNPIKYDKSYIGRKYNYLTIKGILKIDGKRKFECECDCGNVNAFTTTQVVQGIIKSCGCMHNKLLSTHGLSNTRLYSIRRGMIERCYNEKSHAYSAYGGRGIKICDEWLNSESGLQNFVNWANLNGYSDELSIDRIDVNGDYEPSNCRWADDYTQAQNRRPSSEWKERVRKYELDGKMYKLQDLCDMYDTSEQAVSYRMRVMNMTLEQALKTPKKQSGRPRKVANA